MDPELISGCPRVRESDAGAELEREVAARTQTEMAPVERMRHAELLGELGSPGIRSDALHEM
jgi:hypothetical protein